MSSKTTRRVPFGWIALALYMISLFIPALVIIEKPLLWGKSHDELWFGFQCLVIGWLTIPWYANILLWFAAVALMFRRPTLAAALSFAATVMALTTFLYLGDDIRSPHVGYFVWLASMVMVFIAACVDASRRVEITEG